MTRIKDKWPYGKAGAFIKNKKVEVERMKKRLVSLMCAALMAVSLIGCGGGKAANETTKAPDASKETTVAKESNEQKETTKAGIDTSSLEREL